MHATLRLRDDVPDIRVRSVYLAIEEAIRAGCDRFGMRVVQHSAQGNHLHFVVEADDERSLSRGMQGLAIRIARAINRAVGRRGKVFTDRFHGRDLGTPTEVRNAILYVLNNARHHSAKAWPPRRVDPCSSAKWFDGWAVEVECLRLDGPSPTTTAKTWLLRVGWRKLGLLDPAEVPAGSRRSKRSAAEKRAAPWLR
jgi:putative transposase